MIPTQPPDTVIAALRQEWLPVARDIVQIAFFVTIAVVTVLTYLRARRTVLQPIKTEIFKQQLAVFSKILELLAGKGEWELRSDFAFDRFARANVVRLLDAYASCFFDMSFDEKQRPYSRKDCPYAVASAEALTLASDYSIPRTAGSPADAPDPRTRAARWARYKHDPISVPRILHEAVERLHRLASSPLVPKELAGLLAQYESTVNEDIRTLGVVLTELAGVLPDRYPNAESLKTASLAPFHNAYNEKFKPLEPQARAVTDYVSRYFLIDTLLKD